MFQGSSPHGSTAASGAAGLHGTFQPLDTAPPWERCPRAGAEAAGEGPPQASSTPVPAAVPERPGATALPRRPGTCSPAEQPGGALRSQPLLRVLSTGVAATSILRAPDHTPGFLRQSQTRLCLAHASHSGWPPRSPGCPGCPQGLQGGSWGCAGSIVRLLPGRAPILPGWLKGQALREGASAQRVNTWASPWVTPV